MKKTSILILSALFFGSIFFSCSYKQEINFARWTEERANQWLVETGWLTGANFYPSSAINQMEMWQEETFDPDRIDTELGWAASLGFNSMRVYLHNMAWEIDPDGFFDRVDEYLEIADSHNISTMFVIFDAVWNPVSYAGKQPDPIPHTHNSGWLQSPTSDQLKNRDYWPVLEEYVKSVIGRYANDPRVVVWDLYNEPDNDNFGKFPETELPDKRDHTYDLLVKTFEWARSVNPSQPITAGVWGGRLEEEYLHENRFNVFQLENSDVISFHSYDDPDGFRYRVNLLKRYNRPLLCTEYMARTNNSTFEGILSIMKEQKIAGYNWGLVAGKSQTQYPWASWDSVFTNEPRVWFHDIFRPDGTPYSEDEAMLIRGLLLE
jgi:hypothetical protein